MGPIRNYRRFKRILARNVAIFHIVRMPVGRRRAGSSARGTRGGAIVGSIRLRTLTSLRVPKLILSANLNAYDGRDQPIIDLTRGVFLRPPIIVNQTITNYNWLMRRTSANTLREINAPLVVTPAKKKRRITVKRMTRRQRGTVRN